MSHDRPHNTRPARNTYTGTAINTNPEVDDAENHIDEMYDHAVNAKIATDVSALARVRAED